MAPAQSTSIRIRVQARNGKFLGPNVHFAVVSVLKDGYTLFGPALASGDSGVVDKHVGTPLPEGASRNAIAVQATKSGPPAGAYWLEPDAASAGIVATFDLAEPAQLEFCATALRGTPQAVTTSTSMWVVPGMQLTDDPGLILTIPGLFVAVSCTLGRELTVVATVTMMCGCPVTTPTWPEPTGGPEPYWPETEFEVFAVLTPPSGKPASQAMTFTGTNTFQATFPLPPVGASNVAVYAVQRAESNVGFAQQPVTRT